MMQSIVDLDKSIFLFFNGLNTPWVDVVMYYISKTETWIPLYLLLLYYVLKIYKTESWVVLLFVGLTILLSDQTASTILKPLVGRFRPSWEPSLAGLVHLVKGHKGGSFGFPSSHAANTFGTAVFFYLLLGNKSPWLLVLFLWATVVSYSRMYLGVHYPVDILVGGFIGAVYAWISFRCAKAMFSYLEKKRTPSAGQRSSS